MCPHRGICLLPLRSVGRSVVGQGLNGSKPQLPYKMGLKQHLTPGYLENQRDCAREGQMLQKGLAREPSAWTR